MIKGEAVMAIVELGEGGESTQNARLRPVVASIDREMSRPAHGTTSEVRDVIAELLVSWTKLVELMALGAAPELRACPICGHMRNPRRGMNGIA